MEERKREVRGLFSNSLLEILKARAMDRIYKTIFQQFIGKFQDERELSANDTVLRKFISTVDLEGKT